MAISKFFNGRQVVIPGIYTAKKSAINNPPQEADLGKVLIIDTGLGANYGLGAGINGELEKDEEAYYVFNNLVDFRASVRGGTLWSIATHIFAPFPRVPQIAGCSELHYVKAATTVAAKNTLTFADGSTCQIAYRNEGVVGNGVVSGTELTRGCAVVMEDGTLTSTYKFKFFLGTFKGLDSDNDPWDFVTEAETEAELVLESPNFTTPAEFFDWMNSSDQFAEFFSLTSSTVGTGTFAPADVTTFSAYVPATLFAGGTEAFGAADFTSVLDSIGNRDFTWILALDSGSDAYSVDNQAILIHILTQARFTKFLCVAGGSDRDDFLSNSIGLATAWNSQRVHLVHGDPKVQKPGSTLLKRRDSLHKAAMYLGRRTGLAAQTSMTFKSIDMAGDAHQLNNNELTQALDAGVIVTRFDEEWEVLQDINTLQRNTNQVNEDGTSFQTTVELIFAQLNREIEINMKRDLFKKEEGPNRATVSEADVESWLAGYLQRRTADDTTDNLITFFQNVQAQIDADSIDVTYEAEPNFEINKIFVTGFIIDRATL